MQAERINQVLDFLETRLESPVSLDEVAATACYSKFHLIKVFQALMGETVMDYLRKRRISQAGTELLTTSQSILEVALKFQFESQEAFSRSFQQVMGMPPGRYRKRGHRHITFNRYTLSPKDLETLAHFSPMEPRIETIAPKLLIGMRTRTQLADNQIPGLWKRFMPRRFELKNRVDELVYAVQVYDAGQSMESFTPQTSYESRATVEVADHDHIPEGMEAFTLPGGQYAVFLYKGPAAKFGETFRYIMFEWLPQSGYTLDERPHFEVLGPDYLGPAHPDSEEEVWIPIR